MKVLLAPRAAAAGAPHPPPVAAPSPPPAEAADGVSWQPATGPGAPQSVDQLTVKTPGRDAALPSQPLQRCPVLRSTGDLSPCCNNLFQRLLPPTLKMAVNAGAAATHCVSTHNCTDAVNAKANPQALHRCCKHSVLRIRFLNDPEQLASIELMNSTDEVAPLRLHQLPTLPLRPMAAMGAMGGVPRMNPQMLMQLMQTLQQMTPEQQQQVAAQISISPN